ncbi:uncharacterized protein [Periplaneta americana]|uniref:uncharacterized protein n=1 Tax=Periplaneta americana TaxID=6978 RepID=UPI0037E79F0F
MWLVRKKRMAAAERSLQWLCGPGRDLEVKEELLELQKRLCIPSENVIEHKITTKDRISQSLYLIRQFLKPNILKPFLISHFFNTIQCICGLNLFTYYSIDILSKLRRNSSYGPDDVMANIIISVVRLVVSVLTAFLLIWIGRRPVGVVSGLGSFFFATALGILMTVQASEDRYPIPDAIEAWINFSVVLLFIVFISLGFFVLPAVMIGELQNSTMRNYVCGYIFTTNDLILGAVVKDYHSLLNNLGMNGLFFLFGSSCLVCTVFIILFLPETKDRTLFEIEDYFKQDNVLWLTREKSISGGVDTEKASIKCGSCKKNLRVSVLCNGCEVWFHLECQNIKRDQIIEKTWVCRDCGTNSAKNELDENKTLREKLERAEQRVKDLKEESVLLRQRKEKGSAECVVIGDSMKRYPTADIIISGIVRRRDINWREVGRANKAFEWVAEQLGTRYVYGNSWLDDRDFGRDGQLKKKARRAYNKRNVSLENYQKFKNLTKQLEREKKKAEANYLQNLLKEELLELQKRLCIPSENVIEHKITTKDRMSQSVHLIRKFLKPNILKPFLISHFFNTIQCFCGLTLFTYYSIDILSKLRRNSSYGPDDVMANIIISVVRLAASALTAFLLIWIGRRPVGIVSGLGSFFFATVLGILITVQTSENRYPIPDAIEAWINFSVVLLFIVFISLGFFVLPFIMIGELQNSTMRSYVCGYIFTTNDLILGAVVKDYHSLLNTLGMNGLFFLFGSSCLVCTVFIILFLPETKDRTLFEIEDYFKQDNVLWLTRKKGIDGSSVGHLHT